MIKLSVGGTIFETNLNTLKKINYFKYLFEDNDTVDINNVVFVDRPAHVFKHVLAFAIDDTYKYKIKYRNELDFYDIVYDPNKLYDPYKKLVKQLNNISHLTNDLQYDIDNIKTKLNSIDNKLNDIDNKLNSISKQTKENTCKRPECSNGIYMNGFCETHTTMCQHVREGYYGTEYCDNTDTSYSYDYEGYRCIYHK